VRPQSVISFARAGESATHATFPYFLDNLPPSTLLADPGFCHANSSPSF
jgi:hypothetical protein